MSKDNINGSFFVIIFKLVERIDLCLYSNIVQKKITFGCHINLSITIFNAVMCVYGFYFILVLVFTFFHKF